LSGASRRSRYIFEPGHFIAAVVLQQQVIALGTVRAFQTRNARVAPNAVVDMHDIVALAQLQIGRNLQAFLERALRRLLVRPVAEDVHVRCQHETSFGQLEAA
jgi:hypothetical protein